MALPSEWGDCPRCGRPLMTWETIMELGKGTVAVIVRCLECEYDETRHTPAAAEEDLKRLLEELS